MSLIKDFLLSLNFEILLDCYNKLFRTYDKELNDYYNGSYNRSIFVFYSKSADKPPGKGTGEYLEKGNDFGELSKIKNWRKILSNFHYEPFIWRGLIWTSIEEAYQAAKYGPENYKEFREKVREMSKNDEEIPLNARKLRKWKILNDKQIKEWSKISEWTMENIAIAKYNQSDIGRQVLKNTKNAMLLHTMMRSKEKIHFRHLERIRDKL